MTEWIRAMNVIAVRRTIHISNFPYFTPLLRACCPCFPKHLSQSHCLAFQVPMFRRFILLERKRRPMIILAWNIHYQITGDLRRNAVILPVQPRLRRSEKHCRKWKRLGLSLLKKPTERAGKSLSVQKVVCVNVFDPLFLSLCQSMPCSCHLQE